LRTYKGKARARVKTALVMMTSSKRNLANL
jgi:hypothetical protein